MLQVRPIRNAFFFFLGYYGEGTLQRTIIHLWLALVYWFNVFPLFCVLFGKDHHIYLLFIV